MAAAFGGRLRIGDIPEWITIREAALIAGVSAGSVERWAESGRVDAVTVRGGQEAPPFVLVRAADLDWANLANFPRVVEPIP